MTKLQKKSFYGFMVSSCITSFVLSLLIFSGTLKIVLPLVVSATLFSAFFGYALGGYFRFSGKRSNIKAMLLGAVIVMLAFVPTVVIASIAVRISSSGFDVLLNLGKYASGFMQEVGLGAVFTGPVIIPVGAYTGVYVNNT